MSLENAEPVEITEADRRADARAFWMSLTRVVAVAAYWGVSFWIALLVAKGDVAEPLRSGLVWGSVAVSAIVAGLVAQGIQRLDERERSLAWRAMAYAGFALAGMMMGAAAASLTGPEPSRGVEVVPLVALPSLLAFAMLTPLVLRLTRRKGECL